MYRSLHRFLFGDDSSTRAVWPAFALGVFLATFAAYAIDVFAVSGGVVFIAFHAAVVALLTAGVVGYTRHGLLLGWLLAYGALLGARADHAFFGLSYRSFTGQLGYFLQLEGLAVYAIQALVVGGVAFLLGWILRWSVENGRRVLQ